jgi:K+-transporting ATPase A subunit
VSAAAWLQVIVVVAVVGVAYRPLGDYMASVYTSDRHTRVESAIYRTCRIDPDADQPWTHYLGSLLAFSAVGVLGLFGLVLYAFTSSGNSNGSAFGGLSGNTDFYTPRSPS